MTFSFSGYLNQKILYDILSDAEVRRTISSATAACCSTTLFAVTIPDIASDQTTISTSATVSGPGGEVDAGLQFAYIMYIVGGVVALIVIIIVIIVVICVMKYIAFLYINNDFSS